MSRVGDIIERARDTLAEKTPKRWTNARLLRVLSECQKKIARETSCLRYQATIEMCADAHTYKLDATAVETLGGLPLALTSLINHAGKHCTFVTAQRIEKLNEDWLTETGGDITHVIYDQKRPLVFRVYPIPTTADLDTGESLNTVEDPITDAATITQPIATESSFDITAEITPIKMLAKFSHTPPAIITIADTNLLISEHFDLALKHYVVGMTLRDDMDKQNRAFGVEELQLFDSQYQFAQALVQQDFTDQSDEYYAAVTYDKVV